MNDVTVILNGYRRPQNLSKQIEAVKSQTIKPQDIFYWQNTVPDVPYDNALSSANCISAYSNTNFGVWSRFYYALNARTNWVCIFDDDTIPGSKWFENCLTTINQIPDAGLLCTIGIIVNHANYGFERRIGWDNPNETAEQVDFGGHAWFFHRDMLSLMWRELPPINHQWNVGEDIHFSWMLQKYSNYKTYVPPHPKNDQQMWGSIDGWRLGGDSVATAGNGAIPYMAKYLRHAYDNGFRMILGDKVRTD